MNSKHVFLFPFVVAVASTNPAWADEAEDAAKRAQDTLTECYRTAIEVVDDEDDESRTKDDVVDDVLLLCRPTALRYARAALVVVGRDVDEEMDALGKLEEHMAAQILNEIDYRHSKR